VNRLNGLFRVFHYISKSMQLFEIVTLSFFLHFTVIQRVL